MEIGIRIVIALLITWWLPQTDYTWRITIETVASDTLIIVEDLPEGKYEMNDNLPIGVYLYTVEGVADTWWWEGTDSITGEKVFTDDIGKIIVR